MEWETVIGLEVHVQLETNSKLFSTSSAKISGQANTNICAVDLGFPGVLPVLNKKAVILAISLGLSINAKISKTSSFARKNYFYPDLPKGYQISQYDAPIVREGILNIEVGRKTKVIRINRAHLEEDAGKSTHNRDKGFSGIDFNRAGVALLEIVSEPDIRSSEEAVKYLKRLHKLVRYLKISNGNMQEGSFRCDVNISLRPFGSSSYGTRVEIKNLNSFRFVKQAIEHEIKRQSSILNSGGRIIQQTRQFNEKASDTTPMRSKEQECDYRYFPEPDLPPVVIHKDLINQVKKNLPELPWEKLQRMQKLYKIEQDYAGIICSDIEVSEYFEEVVAQGNASPESIAKWICGDVLGYLKKYKKSIIDFPISPGSLSVIISNTENKKISSKAAKEVFSLICDDKNLSVASMIKERCIEKSWDDVKIREVVEKVLIKSEAQVRQYKNGKTKILGFFIGKIMQETKGILPPDKVNKILVEILHDK